MDPRVTQSISERLIELRGGDSVTVFANTIGIDRRTWSQLEGREHYPSLSNLLLISERCGVDIDWIVGRSPTRNKANADHCAYTGLGEKAIENLHAVAEGGRFPGFEAMDRLFTPEVSEMELDMQADAHLEVIRGCLGEAAVKKLRLSPQKELDEDFIGSRSTSVLRADTAFDGHPELDLDRRNYSEFESDVVNTILSDGRIPGLIARYVRSCTFDMEESLNTDNDVLMYDIGLMELIKKEISRLREEIRETDPRIYHRYTEAERRRIIRMFDSIPQDLKRFAMERVMNGDPDVSMPEPIGSGCIRFEEDGDDAQ